MRFIVTRPIEDAVRLINRLERAGHSGVAEPMIRIECLPNATHPNLKWQAILITSANSIRALSALDDCPDVTAVPVLAVGPASTLAATSAGFKEVRTARGDLKALTELAVRQLDPAQGPILYPSGTVVSGDLKARLEAQGFSCTRLPLYDAVPARKLSTEAISTLKNKTADAVLLFSPRSARIWAKCLSTAGLTQAASSLTHYCLSTTIADALNPEGNCNTAFRKMVIAPEPTEDSLLQTIGATD